MNSKVIKQTLGSVKLILFTLILSLLLPQEIYSKTTPKVITVNTVTLQQTISGNVTSNTGEILPGVSIVKKNTNIGAVTNFDGNYTINATIGDILIFSYIGYYDKEVTITSSSTNVVLEPDIEELDSVVVIGYGSQQKRDVTGSIASVGSEEIDQRTPANIFEAIQGQLAGVQLNTGSGAPGSGASIRIRGTSTLNGGADPLYVLDGQPVDNIDNINPNDIASIEILKDGASAAIYGSRSANGVVIVTTKSGKTGKTNINVNYVKSFSKLRTVPVSNAQQRLLYDLLRNTQKNTLVDSLNQMWQYNNNFQDIYFRSAAKDQINVSLSSGSEKTKFYWNTGIINQEGFTPNSSYKRLNTRLNLDHEFSSTVRMGMRIGLSYEETKNINEDQETNLISATLIKAAYSPYINPDGSYLTSITSFRGRANLLDEFERMDVRFRNLRGNLFTYLEFDIFDGLKFRTNNGVDFNYSRNTEFYPEAVNGQNTNVDASFASALGYNWIHESFFNYDKTFNEKHVVSGLLGFSAQKWARPNERIEGQLANSLIPTLNNLGGLESIDLGNTYTQDQNDHALASFFGRATYAYDDKYLFAATYRRDGSSRFGTQNRWGGFPSLSLGWRFGNESFMGKFSFINDAKIRFSTAITGNERINNRDFDFLLSNSNFYQGLNGVGLTNQLGNPGIQWEETQQNNFGLDLSFLKSKINLTIDYYKKSTSRLLANLPLPALTGFSQTRVNIGDVENKGIEIAINATPIATPNFSWSTDFNIAINKNKVLDLAGGVPIISRNHITQVGDPLGSFYGYEIAGIFPYDESNAFTPDGTQLTPNFDGNGAFTNYTLNGNTYNGTVEQISVGGNVSGGGDYHYIDRDGNFNINGEDRKILGNPYPKYYGGWRNQLTYKNFTFSFLFDYQFDVEVYNDFYQTMSNFTLNSWTPVPYIIENVYDGPGDTTALFPDGRRNQNLLGTSAPTSYWVEEADFVKLRNIKLAYEFPSELSQKIGMTRFSIFGSINNALVWTNYKGFDPETTGGNANALGAGVDPGRYPRGREFLLGINLNF